MDRAVSAGNNLLPRNELMTLVARLQGEGFRVVGPQVQDGTILYRTLQGAGQLPWGFGDSQQPGSYRLEKQGARAFAWANGPQGLKPFTFAPQETLWQVARGEDGLVFQQSLPPAQKLALIGVRSCDLAALALQDQHFLHGGEADGHYARRRQGLFIIAVNCTHPAATCFCAATGDGPNADSGYDLLLDELDEGYLVTAGSETGRFLQEGLPLEPATPAQQRSVMRQREQARAQQRTLPQTHLHGGLMARADSSHWEAIAGRCLACGNCTAVCPTCFCHSEHEEPSLDGTVNEHLRQWDSCFSPGHSYIHGITIRAERAQRYRQWLTHKFDNWHEQYGRSGCVGCGRCITWCPVGIDVTEELAAICGGAS